MVSGNVGADVDADFSDIKEASFVRKQVKADGNIDASDVEAERPIRKHAISWKVGANGEVSGPKTSLVRKQMRANASIHVSDAEAERPVRKQNDCPAGGFCSACGTCSPGRCADGSCPLFDGKCTCGDGSCPSKVASNICQTCVDCSARSRASTETGDGSFCYKLNHMVSTNPDVCDGYWSRGRNQATRSPCVYKDAASSRSGVERCESGPVPCC